MKLKTWQLAGMFLLSVLIPMLAVVTFAKQQPITADLQPCRPPVTEFDYWQRVRSMPVKFTDIDRNTAYWKFEDKTGVHLGSFQLEKFSLYFDAKLEKKDRLYFEFNLTNYEWGVNYDSDCFSILSATKLK
jgi:hypothetical protein